MSFSLYGSVFTDKVTTVTAGFLNYVRTSLANAIDGASGGTYAPSSALTINGSGLSSGGSGLTLTGPLIYSGDSQITTRRGKDTLLDSAMDFDATADLWLFPSFRTLTAARSWTLITTPTPGFDTRVRLTVRGNRDSNLLTILNGGAGAGTLCTIGGTTGIANIEFYFDGTNWRVFAVALGTDTTLGAAA